MQIKHHIALPGLMGLIPACLLAFSSPLMAQLVPAKPGLWASASQAMLNGKKLPTIFDIKGAMPAAEKAAMKNVMAQIGLPQDWNPSLACEQATSVDISQIMADLKSQGCASTITAQTASRIDFDLSCSSPQGSGKGKAYAENINTDKVTYNFKIAGVSQGMPMKYEATRVSKLIATDCANPPPGINPKWLGMLQH